MPSFFDMQKFAATGIAAPDMTAFDKMRALAAFGGGKTQTLTGTPPLSFKADGTPLISWSMKGNGQQTGTPTPDNPVMPTFCGKLVGSDWTIPITCAGQTQTVNLGYTQTVRRIKKRVLDGTENWGKSQSTNTFYIQNSPDVSLTNRNLTMCSHFEHTGQTKGAYGTYYTPPTSVHQFNFVWNESATVEEWKAYLAQQYAAGTPVTVWYVLANEQTGIVNEPLAKIGDYADELHSENAGVTIPTAKGQNVLTVDTELQPSEMTIEYRG